MKPSYFLTLVAPVLAAVRPAEWYHHRGHADMSDDVPLSLGVEFAGLTAMSRVLWLETVLLAETKDAQGLVEVMETDIIIETSSLLYYTSLASRYDPLGDKTVEREVFVGVQAWELMTTQFLGLLAESADKIEGSGEKSTIARQLKEQKDVALSFVDAFGDALPDLKDVFKVAGPALEKKYDSAIDALSGSSSKDFFFHESYVPAWK